MSSAEPTASSPLSVLVTQRRQVAVGLALAGVVLAALAIWWGVWGFARSGDAGPAKSEGKLIAEETKPAPAEDTRPKKSPDYQIACIWAGGLALLALLSAAWVYTQPPDPAAPLAAARKEVLALGGTVGLLTALCGAMLGYRWHQSLVLWVGGGDPSEAKWVLYAAAIFLAGLLIMFASLQLARTEQRANATLRRVLYGFNTVFVGLLLLLVLIAVNIVSFIKVPKTLVTNDTAFTELSDESKRFLKSLDRPVHVYLIMPEAHAEPLGRGAVYENLYADCRALLSQCEDQSSNFHAAYLSPAFQKEQIAALMDRLKVKEADRDQLGMLAAVGENEEATTFIRAGDLIDVDRRGSLVFQGENKLLTELMYLTDARAREKIYFTQGHGELEMQAGADGNKAAGNMVQFLRDRKLSVEPLSFETPGTKVPDDAAVVVVAGLRRTLGPDDPMLTALKDYARRPNRPGKLFLLLPAFRDAQGKVAATGLEPFLAEFGVEVDAGHRLVAVPRQLPVPPEYVLLSPFARIDADLARIVGQGQLILRDTRPVRPAQAPPGGQFKVTPLMGTDLVTWQEDSYLTNPDQMWAQLRAQGADALRQEKHLTQRPISAAVGVAESAPGGGEKATSKPRMLVFGSDTFIQDQTPVPSGVEEYRQLLFSDGIDWLREREASSGIPPRKVGIFSMEKPIDWPSQVVLLALVSVGVTVLGVGVWLSRRR